MKSSSPLSDLFKEALLILLLSYFTLVAGSLDGLAHFRTRISTHFIIVIILAIWLGTRAQRGESLPRTPLDAPIVGFLGANAVATVLSVDPRLSLESLLQTCTYVFIFYLLVDLLRNEWPVNLFVKSLLVVGGIACLLGLIEAVTWYLDWLSIAGLSDFVPPMAFRLSGGNSMAAYLNLLIPLGIMEAIRVRRHSNRVIIIVWLLTALVIQFLTFSRGGWLGLAVALVSICALLILNSGGLRPLTAVFRNFGKREKALSIVCALAIGIPLLLAAGQMGYRQITAHPSHAGSTEAHLTYWRSAIATLLEHPLSGAGPYNYGTQLLKHDHPPSRWLVEKAHNALLTIGAETGILGLAAVAWLTLALARDLYQAWSRAGQRQRFIVIACTASLAASFFHNLVEDFLGSPGIIITTISLIVLSLQTTDGAVEESTQPITRTRLPMSWLAIPVLIIALCALWIDVPSYYFSKGTSQASAGNSVEAIPYLEYTARLDPSFAFYHLQLGYVYGLVAAADTDGNQYLPEAIAAYERGIAREPHFAYNKANLASLYWQAGLGEEAIDLMKQALEALPREPLFHLNLGYYAELSGDTEQAVREYTRFLSGNAHLARASFWRQTPLRRSLLQEGQDTFLMARRPSSPQSYRDYVTVAWREYEDGHIEQAEAYFEHARTINPALPDAYRGLAQVNLQLGHLAEAQCLAKKALFLGDASEPHFILGRSAYLQGYLPRAIDEYVLALTEYFYAGKYGLLIFHRDFIQAPELLPQLIQLNFTDYHATRSVELAQLYEEAGASQRAMQVYQMVLEYDPTFESALEGLERLGGT